MIICFTCRQSFTDRSGLFRHSMGTPSNCTLIARRIKRR